MRHTPLFERHMRDASMVINLKGFARAMHYRGHIAEHRATREGVTLCDVSHMGELEFRGPDALALVQSLITNDAARLAIGQALYSALCNTDGTIIDDLVCYRLAADHFVWVVNVTKTDEDFQWVLRHARGMNVTVGNLSADTALLALQGPESREVLQKICEADLTSLGYYRLVQTRLYTPCATAPCMVSRTGYTGERGYEIMVARELAPLVWDELMRAGQPLGIMGQGVAARESLRTEAGYLLNGNDMDSHTNPFEVGIGWVVKLDKEFIGRQALADIKARPLQRRLVGLEVEGSLTVRHGCKVYAGAGEVGMVTSGPLSVELAGRNLGLAHVASAHSAIGSSVEVEVNGVRRQAHVVPMPFRERRTKDEPAVDTLPPSTLRCSDAHVWAHAERDTVTLGLTEFGQRSLGDIVSLELPSVGCRLAPGEPLAWLSSYRRALELPAPIGGEIVAVNASLAARPGTVNMYPYSREGLVRIRPASSADLDALMDFGQYRAFVARLQDYDAWSRDRRMT